MANFGATVKAFADLIDRAAEAIETQVRSLTGRPKPKPCPIPLPVKSGRDRR